MNRPKVKLREVKQRTNNSVAVQLIDSDTGKVLTERLYHHSDMRLWTLQHVYQYGIDKKYSVEV